MESKSASKSNLCLDELIFHFGRGLNGTTFNELAAVYERMLEIAFHEVSTPNGDRALAANWAGVLESLIVLTLVGHEDILRSFMEARNLSKLSAEKYGYGSIGWVAIHDPKNTMTRIWPDDQILQKPERSSIDERRIFLLSAAFGREADASTRGG